MVLCIILADRLGNISATQTLKQPPNFRTKGQAFIVHLVSLTRNILAQDFNKDNSSFLSQGFAHQINILANKLATTAHSIKQTMSHNLI